MKAIDLSTLEKDYVIPEVTALPPGPEDALDITDAKVIVKSGHVVLCNRCTDPLVGVLSDKKVADALRERHAALHRGKNARIMEILGNAQNQRDAAGKPV